MVRKFFRLFVEQVFLVPIRLLFALREGPDVLGGVVASRLLNWGRAVVNAKESPTVKTVGDSFLSVPRVGFEPTLDRV